ncbi:DUF475 domain-containing protein [bacterium]|nr:DUF475 domain-containing protein [bacterium]MBU1958600.1 DUF475 domain-containing protein [bacterium]
MRHFKSSIAVTAIGLTLALYIGGFYALYIVALLAILEISLSFDNAVVNAKVLETMEPKWQQRFITFGIPIAVFGMRFLFPIVIVSVASGLGILETFNLAFDDPLRYQTTLVSVEKIIFAFGGSFLLMVFLDFLFDTSREEQWIERIEGSKTVQKMAKISSIQMMIAIAIGLILIMTTQQYEIALAYFMGILLHALIASLDEVFSTNGVRSGILGFLYLEVLDASFSFDGVIGAFALSSNIFIIMIGLGIGAMFVRSLTLYMLEKKTLTEYRYLEHGAHYAIFALALIMLLKIFFHINEVLVGTVGIIFITVATYHSIQANKKVAVECLKN